MNEQKQEVIERMKEVMKDIEALIKRIEKNIKIAPIARATNSKGYKEYPK